MALVSVTVIVPMIVVPTSALAQAEPSSYLPLLAQSQSAQAGAPVIHSFVADPATVTAGGESVLRWQVSGATTLSIEPTLGTVSGTFAQINPATTTEYTLTATNANGSTMAKTTVTVTTGGEFQYTTFLLPYDLEKSAFVSKVPQLALDGNGGTHVIYTSNFPDDSGVSPAFYAYCPANCTSADAFRVARLSDQLSFAQLAVDAQGRPRVLLASELPDPSFGVKMHWTYGECNLGCTDAANWTLTEIAVARWYWGAVDMESNQSFALDANGNPRLLYFSNSFAVDENTPVGTIFTYCDGDCTQLSNWYTTILSDATWENLALTLTRAGLPRIAYTVTNNEGVHTLGYAECDNPACTFYTTNYAVLTHSYATLALSGYVYTLRLDSQDRPRLAYYPGWGDSGSLPGQRLYYITCNAGCTQPGTWQATDLGLPAKTPAGDEIWNGDSGADLAFDKQDRPRIAMHMGNSVDELVYLWCNSGCEASANNWSYQVIWSTAAQVEEMGLPPSQGCPDCIPPIPPCPTGFWDAGYWPSLALDSAGNPRIAYEVQEQTGGGKCTAATWAKMSRFAIFNQP
jgi:hypothetical protein